MIIREERTGDEHQIDEIVAAAFANHPHSNQTEHILVSKLRAGNALTLSLVNEQDGRLAAHFAFSPVQIEGGSKVGTAWAPSLSDQNCSGEASAPS